MCAPKYGAGRGLSTVAWISCSSSMGALICRLLHFVEEFVERLADALESSHLAHRQIRIRDVPRGRSDLIADEPVLDRWAANARPPDAIGEQDVHGIGDLRREVIDVGVPLAV